MIRTTVFAAVIAAAALPAFAAEQQARITDTDVATRVATAQADWNTKLQINADQRDRASVTAALRMAAAEVNRGNHAGAAGYLSVAEQRLSR